MVSLAAPFSVVRETTSYCLACQYSIASADIFIESLSEPSNMEGSFDDADLP